MTRHLGKIASLTKSEVDINKYIEKAIEEGNSRVLRMDKFNKSHLYKMIQKHPDIGYSYTSHPDFDQKAAEMLLENSDKLKSYDIASILGKQSEGYTHGHTKDQNAPEHKLNLNPNLIHSMLEKHGHDMSGSTIDMLLDHSDSNFKKQWTDSKLGITGGMHTHSHPYDFQSDEDFSQENWDNFEDSESKHRVLSEHISKSRHLDDEQAEHIKRHGNIQEKYNLYHNKHVDPRHGVEMFQKWYDDDSHHGYDAADLTSMHKNHRRNMFTHEDVPENIREEIIEESIEDDSFEEEIERRYSFADWVDENAHNIARNEQMPDDLLDEIYDELYNSHDDWTAENPNSSQNEGDQNFNLLNMLYDHGRKNDDDYISKDKIEELTNVKIEELGLEDHVDDDGDVDHSIIKDKLDEYGGPLMIDFANHDDYSINEHPDFDDRFDKIAGDMHERHIKNNAYDYWGGGYHDDYMDSDGYIEAFNDAQADYIMENASEHIDSLYDSSHQSHRFIPNHLHPHIPNYQEIVNNEKKLKLDGLYQTFLNQHIKDRSNEHEYGEDQHFHEMVRDHAEANGGKIDVGTMNKLYPNQKEKWKKVFGGKGKLTHEEASQKVNELPKTKYDITYGKWKGDNMQNVNGQDQIIFRLDHSEDSLKPIMADSDLYNTFKNVQNVSKQSGHPTNSNTIAWARVDTSDPNHWMIDEVQSDFGKTVTRYLKQNNADDKASHIDTINSHHKNWRENIINSVLKEAKKHGAEKVSTHSPESKSRHTGSRNVHSVYKDSYKKIPRSMGFQSSHYKELPLTEKGQRHFKDLSEEKHKAKQDKDLSEPHYSAWAHHSNMANEHELISNLGEKNKEHHLERVKLHRDIASKHFQRAKHYNPGEYKEEKEELNFLGPAGLETKWQKEASGSIDSEGNKKELIPHESDILLNEELKKPKEFKESEDKSLQGHTFHLTPQLIKKSMDYTLEYLDKLEKGEFIRSTKAIGLALGLGIAAQHVGKVPNKKPPMNNKRMAIINANKQAKVEPVLEPKIDQSIEIESQDIETKDSI